ncbi:unnamed protein product, partial [Symbiodinium sp. CCMP2456]
MSGFSVTVKAVRDRKLISPTFQVAATDSQPSIYLEVEEAELQTDPKSGILQLICRDGTVEFGDEGKFEFPDERVIYLDHLNSVEINEDSASPANLTLRAIPLQIDREKKIIDEAKASIESLGENPDPEQLKNAEYHHNEHQKRLYRLQAERQRRLANGFGVFCFVCMGIPVAVWRKSSDNVSTFFTCFLPILLLYYPLLVIGEQTARDGTFGAVPVWIANVVLFAIGALSADPIDASLWTRRTMWLVLGLGLFRLVYLAFDPFDLVHDEAYYWDWSRQLDYGYFSKPPMIAWLIGLSTRLLGDHEFAVRLPAVLLGTGSLAFVFMLARRMYDAKVGFWATMLVAMTPGNVAMSLLMTIDAPFLFFWSAAMYCFWRLLEKGEDRWKWLVATTVVIGLGLLTKQTMAGMLVFGGLF